MRGKTESNESYNKKIAITFILKKRMLRKFKEAYIIKDNFDWDRLIPSPTANKTKLGTVNLLTCLNERDVK